MDNEIWKPIKGYEGLYEVSNLGRVKSLSRHIKRKNDNGYISQKKIMKLSRTTTGYWKVKLVKGGKRRDFKVHRLVAFAFLPTILGKNIINHKDGNPLNNEVDNLEWCNQSENMKHAAETQLMPNNFNLYKHQITNEYIECKTSVMQLSKKYNCSDEAIRKHFKANNIRIRNISEIKDKYNIDRLVLIQDFKSGMRNVDIAQKHNTNRLLIGTYKNKFKKEGLL